MPTRRLFVVTVLAVLLAVGAAGFARQPTPRWITAWATSQHGLGQDGVTDATVRLIARVTVGGESVRVRLDNTYGTEPLQIGSVYLGQRQRGPALLSGSNMPVRFAGATSVTIPVGGSVSSDPVRMARARPIRKKALTSGTTGLAPSRPYAVFPFRSSPTNTIAPNH